MIQKGDDLINGGGYRQQYFLYHQNNVNSQRFANGDGQLVQAMSFDDDLLSQGESTLPSIETVLPHYAIAIPTPPPSLPSPSVNIASNSTTTAATTNHNVTTHQFQLQHLTPQYSGANINLQQQPVAAAAFHSTSSAAVQLNHMLNTNENCTNIASTTGGQLFVDYNKSNGTFSMEEEFQETQSNLNVDMDDDNIVKNVVIAKSTYKIDSRHANNTESYQLTKKEQKHDDSIYISDASTVDADENLDEQYAYLSNLNSDNLMKYSQQSADMSKLIEERIMEQKANINVIPTCEEHDDAGYDFRIEVNSSSSQAQGTGVVYSKDTQRLYVRTNENVYIDCFYKYKMPIQPLHVRVFAVYTKDTSEPVLRCQNHISKDTESDEIKRNSLVRCQNPDATYYGTDAGKCINERYSVLVPLNASVKVSDSNNHLKQQLIVNFTCNNSCMNRKQTSAIFLLETTSGETLAKRVLNVKISTCPKRDKKLYEEQRGSSNRRRPLVEPDYCGASGPKMAKYDDSSIKDEVSRSSYEDASDDDASRPSNAEGGGTGPSDMVDVHQEKDTGDYILTLKYKTRQQLLQALRVLYSNAITNEVFYDTSKKGRRLRESECLKKGYEKALRIKGRSTANIDCQ